MSAVTVGYDVAYQSCVQEPGHLCVAITAGRGQQRELSGCVADIGCGWICGEVYYHFTGSGVAVVVGQGFLGIVFHHCAADAGYVAVGWGWIGHTVFMYDVYICHRGIWDRCLQLSVDCNADRVF